MSSNEVGRRLKAFGLCSLLGLAFLAGYQHGRAEEGTGMPARLSLQILWDRPLPAELGPAVDVRWASDKSVFLALPQKGVVEVALEPFGKRLREVIPGAAKPGGMWSTHLLGVSRSHLAAAAAAGTLTWRRLKDPLRREFVDFDAFEDMDIGDGRVCVLGARRDDKSNFAPEGAVAWLGSLDQDLKDLRPIVFDYLGPGAGSLNACGGFRLGAVRFMHDGSLVVVPGFQPGIYFFDVSGRLSRVVDSATLGLDTDCRGFPSDVISRYGINLQARYAWINQHRSLDDILALLEGPGFLVRQVGKEGAAWKLRILKHEGGVEERSVPIAPQSEFAHVRADLRGRQLLLLVKSLDIIRSQFHRPRLIYARLKAPSETRESQKLGTPTAN